MNNGIYYEICWIYVWLKKVNVICFCFIKKNWIYVKRKWVCLVEGYIYVWLKKVNDMVVCE